MFNMVLFSQITISFILVSSIFFIISFYDWWLNVNIVNLEKVQIFECGFLSTATVKLPIFFNSLLLLLFVILYEIEIFIILPAFVEFLNVTLYLKTKIVLFLLAMFITLFFDLYYQVVRWVF